MFGEIKTFWMIKMNLPRSLKLSACLMESSRSDCGWREACRISWNATPAPDEPMAADKMEKVITRWKHSILLIS